MISDRQGVAALTNGKTKRVWEMGWPTWSAIAPAHADRPTSM